MKRGSALCGLLLVFVAGCGFDGRASGSIGLPTPVRTTTPTPTFYPLQFATASGPTPTPTAVPTITPVSTIAPVAGSSRQMPLPRDATVDLLGWRIKVIDVVRGDAARDTLMERNEFNPTPDDAEEYVLVTLEAENNGDDQEPQNPRFAIQASITGDSNVIHSNPGVVVPQPFADAVPPGGRTQGQVAVIVPRDEGNLLLVLQDAAARGTGARFVALDGAASVSPDPALARIAATDVGASSGAPAALGTQATTEDWQITVIESVRGEAAKARIMGANEFTEPPAYTQEFVAVRVRMRSIADADPDALRFITSSYFQISDRRQASYDPLALVGPDPLLDAVVFGGGAGEGWITFAVPETEDELLFVFRSSAITGVGDTRYFAVR